MREEAIMTHFDSAQHNSLHFLMRQTKKTHLYS